MTTELTTPYEFDGLPIRPIAAGTNVLVAGPTLDGARRVLFELLVDRDEQDGVVLVSADIGGNEAMTEFERVGGQFDLGRMCIVDCTQQGGTSDGPIRQVTSPEDLTGIGIEFSSLYESLYGRGRSGVRVGLNSVSTLLVYADDFRAVYRFLHTVTSRIRTADGLGVASIDPEATDEKSLGAISQAFDARIDVRNADNGPEIRIQGLDDQPEGWQAITAE